MSIHKTVTFDLGERDSLDEDDSPRVTRHSAVYSDSTKSLAIDLVVHPKTEDERLLIKMAMSRWFLFQNLDRQQQEKVIDVMYCLTVAAGEDIFKRGGSGDKAYVIEKGLFKSFGKSEDDKLKMLTEKGMFGEAALLHDMVRDVTVRALSNGKLWVLERSQFKAVLNMTATKRRQVYMKFLDSCCLFSVLTQEEKSSLVDILHRLEFSSGHAIIKMSGPSDGMYFIEEGEVEVVVNDDKGSEVVITKLCAGEYFGERAMFTDKPRNATVRAKGETAVAFLKTEDFARVFGEYSRILSRKITDREEYIKSLVAKSLV